MGCHQADATKQAAWLAMGERLDVGKTPAQSRGDDQNDGDRTEISGLLSSRQMLPHFSDHLELALKRFGIISSSLYSYGCSPSEQNWSLH
jgi:hypothetical protein